MPSAGVIGMFYLWKSMTRKARERALWVLTAFYLRENVACKIFCVFMTINQFISRNTTTNNVLSFNNINEEDAKILVK